MNEVFVKRDLKFSCLGDGLTVTDLLHEVDGEGQVVAHIGSDRRITYFVAVATVHKQIIEKEAEYSDPSTSANESSKVFLERPVYSENTNYGYYTLMGWNGVRR